MMKKILMGLVALPVLALTANLFANDGAGYGVPLHPYIYYAVGGMALAVPTFWALAHVCMGTLMGLTGGGLKEGLKLGFMLGLGMALGRSWLNIAAVGVGIWVGQGPRLWALLALGGAVLLFALDWVIHYFWHHRDSSGN